MKKSLSYLALIGIVASFGAGAVGSAPASAATLSNATRLVLDTTGGDPIHSFPTRRSSDHRKSVV